MRRILRNIRKTLWRALDHDVFNTAKAVAYSGMLCVFPAALVFTALLAMLPVGSSLVDELRNSLESLLPPGSMSLLSGTLNEHPLGSTQLILSATSLSLFAGLGVMLSLMEGFRRAYRRRRDDWGFWQKRFRALMLVPIVLVPLALASLLLMFGHQIEVWMVARSGHELRHVVLFFWRLVRWALSVTTAVTVLAALYHFGTRQTEHWGWVLPGALGATLMWFPATLAFGWYVTRVADYSRFYGSFAAGIATLVWLYLTSFSALLGAEFNGTLCEKRLNRAAANNTTSAVPSL
ncbi:YihY/virulence factor BrkB family protein [Occallatibacter riparius]|uniref:YihY/virulence factor BrkB family protein n=1 Tax=Occallatibacter riparius TaxID=1002689 RepID=A0A9J7BVA6_9BACT|nr:YihY/virulence factor BrkB family protein [Occallatibacter riparius]UWZ84941.1 YihY/virulence factor BrkB family protein [Occallatibacter riparius]